MPFLHGDRCRTPAAEPEWYENGEHRWQRTCSCGDEYREMYTGQLEPTSPAAEPSKRAHLHAPGCEASGLDAMVAVEFSPPDRAWRSHCLLCTTTQLYWYQPDRVEMNDAGDLHPVRRRGNTLYDYELARQQVPA
jgi:hypothetical protein